MSVMARELVAAAAKEAAMECQKSVVETLLLVFDQIQAGHLHHARMHQQQVCFADELAFKERGKK